jgi:hypothetical protein
MKKKNFIPGSTKFLLALTSLAGTVGLWNIISNQSLVAAQKASTLVEVPVDLAPLPTLVPLVQVTLPAAKSEASAAPATALRKVTPSTVNPAPKAPAAVSNPVVIPNPVTTTGSSK